MSSYKLCYFNARGIGELSRWLFADAEQEFEDYRWEREDWEKNKANSPTGQAPWLEVDGQKIAQSTAINSFLAKRFGRFGKDEFEEAKVNMVVGCCTDLFLNMVPIFMEADEDKKTAVWKKVKEEKGPDAVARLENLLKSNNGGDGYFVGDDATLADYQLTLTLDVLEPCKLGDLLDAAPKLVALRERVMARPNIAAWIGKRPKTEH